MASSNEKDAAAVDHADDTLHDTGAAVQLAHDADDTTYSPWSLRMFRLYLVLCVAYLCGCLNGYDGSLMGGLVREICVVFPLSGDSPAPETVALLRDCS
jgi:hypothetical protein